ncbi:neprilysin-1-like [Paramacrobiotus metropolitanus]|uniref:neprilysin-1-like n=1 Tax=Paramacrobiotus metropolitanus TaxID=2943436 RepID=UPI00244629E7|nr:neprilysin-1-like [Paramacrobiotus metropolitanus]
MLSVGEILDHIQSLAMMVSVVISGWQTGKNATGQNVHNNIKSPESIGHSAHNGTTKATKSAVCESPTCLRAGQELLSSIDPNVDPCEDLFAYTCNNWIKSHPVPSDKQSVSILSEMGDIVNEQLLGVLYATASEKIFKSKAMVKDFFKKCVNEDGINADGMTFVQNALTETIGQWPPITPAWNDKSPQITSYLYRLSKLYNARSLIQLNVDKSLHNSSQMVLYLGIDSGFEKEIVNGLMLDVSVNGTLDMVSNVISSLLHSKNLTGVIDERSILNDATSIVEWEIFLANISLPAVVARKLNKAFINMTFAELQSRYFSKSSVAKNFRDLLENMISSGNFTYQITPDMDIYVTNPAAFQALDNRLLQLESDPRGQRGLITFLGWRLLDLYSSTLPFSVRRFFEEYSRLITGMEEQEPRWKDCISYASELFPLPVGALYTDAAVPKEARASLQKMIKDLKAAMREMIDGTSWMSRATKEEALAKLDNMAEFVLYPDWFVDPAKLDHDYSEIKSNASLFELSRFGMNLQYQKEIRRLEDPPTRLEMLESLMVTSDVNAFYEPNINGIGILAGISQYPYFDAELPEYFNYAGMGTTVGHEFTHGFDDAGSMFDKDGNLRDWWTPADKAKYDQKASEVIQQYDMYESYTTGIHVNGNLTQGENIADGGGFKAAFLAYRKLERDGVTMQALPGFEGVPFDKMFYLAYAYGYCEQYRPELSLLTDPHSPGKYRVNGIVVNTPDFARIFNCPKDSQQSHQSGVW